MSKDVKDLEKQVKLLDEKIQDQKERIPKHSIRPNMLIELEELEDERDAILNKINEMKKNGE